MKRKDIAHRTRNMLCIGCALIGWHLMLNCTHSQQWGYHRFACKKTFHINDLERDLQPEVRHQSSCTAGGPKDHTADAKTNNDAIPLQVNTWCQDCVAYKAFTLLFISWTLAHVWWHYCCDAAGVSGSMRIKTTLSHQHNDNNDR